MVSVIEIEEVTLSVNRMIAAINSLTALWTPNRRDNPNIGPPLKPVWNLSFYSAEYTFLLQTI